MANLQRYSDPFGGLVDDLFRGFFVRPMGYEGGENTDPVRRARIEVAEKDGEYRVHAELPGAKKDDIHVEVHGDQVSISAEVKRERDVKEGERVVHSERYYGKIARTFRLGEEIDEARVQAKFNDGVLELSLPKKVVAGAKRISVE